MGICRFCGQDTGWFGWFRNSHAACEALAKKGCHQIVERASAIADRLIPTPDRREDRTWCAQLAVQIWAEVAPQLDCVASECRVPADDNHRARLQGWSKGTERVSLAEPISIGRVAALVAFYRAMGLSDEEIKRTAGFRAMSCSSLLWFVMVHGDPTPVASKDRHPFNLATGEIPLLLLPNVVYLKETVTTSYQGGHAGLSVRVAKGVYYHVGGFNGRRIQTASLKRADQGAMLLTTQNLYFGGAHTNFRIPYERVLSCRSYTDGIGLFRDSANAKPEVFSVIEAGNAVNAHPITGWLLFNLVKFLAQPEGRALYTAKRQKQAHPARAINQ